MNTQIGLLDGKSADRSADAQPSRLNARALRLWRWCIPPLSFVLVLIIEISEGHMLLDAPLLIELGVYGLLLPGLGWVGLTGWARHLEQLDHEAAEAVRRRSFTQQLAQSSNWAELTRFITHYPSLRFAVEYAVLYVCEPAAPWPLKHCPVLPLRPAPYHNRPWHDVIPARRTGHLPRSLEGGGYCLPLHEPATGQPVGMLHLVMKPGARLSAAETSALWALAPEITRALCLAQTHQHHLEQAQQHERQEVAAFLHNTLAQQLGYLHLSLDRLATDDRRLEAGPLRTELLHLREVAQHSYSQARDLLAALQPEAPGDLAQLIERHLQALAVQHGPTVTVTSAGPSQALTPELTGHVLGLVQEALSNARRHAQATCVALHLEWTPTQLRLSLRDNGRGFDPAAEVGPGHFGLRLMRERTAVLGGQLQVTSVIGQGTELRFDIPCAAAPPFTETLHA